MICRLWWQLASCYAIICAYKRISYPPQGHGGWNGAPKHSHKASNEVLSSDVGSISHSTYLIFDPKVI